MAQPPCRFNIQQNRRLAPTPATAAKIKKPRIFSRTSPTLSPPPARLLTRVSATRPSTSSIRAAARMVLPTFVSSLPISFRVSTVMLTEVAVRIVPTNTFSSIPLLSIKPAAAAPHARAVPMSRGTITPSRATQKPALPLCFSSLMSVPIPAENISTMTPNSLSWEINSVSVRTFSPAGPRIRPASKAPTT